MTNTRSTRRSVKAIFVLLFCTSAAQAAVTRVPIASGVVLTPGEAHTIRIEATEPTEIGWRTVQPKACATNCVQATDLTSPGITTSIATPLGASKKYTPASGTISIEYKNVSAASVTIDIYRVERTCDAEACRFVDPTQKASWLVFKVDEFTSITTSRDESYSVISGIATGGRPFRFKAIWWTDEKPSFGVNCPRFVKGYLDRHTPKDQYRPYVISGQAVGDAPDIVLKSVDTCVPKATKFGVPEKNVYK